jgi:hypothetical protein
VRCIADELRAFVAGGGKVRFVVGVDQHGTSREGLQDLLAALEGKGEAWVYHDEESYTTFHPKVYLLSGPGVARLIVGSANLTQGGLYSNDELSLAVDLDLSQAGDSELLDRMGGIIARWCDPAPGTARLLDAGFLQELVDAGYVWSEAATRAEDADSEATRPTFQADPSAPAAPLFGRGGARPRPPKRVRKDEPHVRGEIVIAHGQDRRVNGPPPRAWGNPIVPVYENCASRSTPTCVGKSGVAYRSSPASTVHPHVRGEI